MTDATELDEAAITEWRRDAEGALRVLMQRHRRQDHERILAALDEITRLRAALRLAMSTLTDALDVMHRATGLPDEHKDKPELIEETLLGLRAALDEARTNRQFDRAYMLGLRDRAEQAEARAEAAEQERDKARAEVERLKSPERDTTGLTYGDKAAWRDLVARAEAAKSALAAVRALHRPVRFKGPVAEWHPELSIAEEDDEWCDTCNVRYPCPTTAALATPTTTDEGDTDA